MITICIIITLISWYVAFSLALENEILKAKCKALHDWGLALDYYLNKSDRG